MSSILSSDRIRVFLNRMRERLWVKPTVIALLSIAAAFAAKLADGSGLGQIVPSIAAESVESLLSVMAASMLVIATFAVASMVSAFSSASSVATPRSFSLVVSDDVSQNALSTFIGAFIFSIVALTAVKNEYFGDAGLFTLFVLTVGVFGMVVLTFVRWVDRIARLGRLGATIDKVEEATGSAMDRRRRAPTLQGVPVTAGGAPGHPVFAETVGYVQHIDIAALQAWAEHVDGRVVVAALPGTFAAPGRALAYIRSDAGGGAADERDRVLRAFQIGDDRLFDDDPRFGLIVLSEIAGRALSPGINDPGTAIDILGTLVRLFARWCSPAAAEEAAQAHDRVAVPEISVGDMFDDAFTAIGRDGAGAVEVAVRLQKALESLTRVGDAAMRQAAVRHGRQALARAERAMDLPEDLAAVREATRWAGPAGSPDTALRSGS